MRQSREASIREAGSRPHWGRTPKPSPRNAKKNNRRPPAAGGEPPPTAADAQTKNPRRRNKKSNAPTTAMRQSREASIRRRRKAAPIGGGRPNQAPATRQRTTAAPPAQRAVSRRRWRRTPGTRTRVINTPFFCQFILLALELPPSVRYHIPKLNRISAKLPKSHGVKAKINERR